MAAPVLPRRPPRLTLARARAWRRRWDAQQVAGVEAREERFEFLLAALRAGVGRRFRFLDLGSGTGSLSERVLRRFPESRGVALDFDPVLLALARRALSGAGARLRWVETDLRDPRWVRALPTGQFDAAVSSTALHWFTPTELGGLYEQLARRVRRGGLFLNADSLAYPPSEPAIRRIAREARRTAAPAPATGESWEGWWTAIEREPALRAELDLRRARFPTAHMGTPTADLSGHVRRLRAAGFREADVIWSHGNNRLLAAVR